MVEGPGSCGAPGHAFDASAAEYDAAFTYTRLGGWMRAVVWEQLAATFHPGDVVLELGCGTGEDAVWLAQRGVQVVATDASPAMLDVARRKVLSAGMAHQVRFEALDLVELSSGDWAPGAAFDGVLSNFGALNCMPDRRPLAHVLAGRVRPGGRAVLVVMGPLCPWEVIWHLLGGRVGAAFRRFRAGALAHVGGGEMARVWYPSPRRLRAEFAPHFRHRETVGIGAVLPPPYLGQMAERWPRLCEALAMWERRLGRSFPWTWLNDHYLVVLERS